MKLNCPYCNNLIELTVSKLQKKKDDVINNDILSELKLNKCNLGNSVLTKKIRYEEINYEFKYKNPLNTSLQCTEYVQYRIKQVLNIVIKWPIKTGRHGGKWADIFEKYMRYKILNMPKEFCAISLKERHGSYGHVAFIEKVLDDESIKISETNYPSGTKGEYNERILSKSEWQDKYKGRFIDFA